MITSKRTQVEAYETRDGSLIRELMHPSVQGNQNQSLAEATVYPAAETRLHRYGKTEEIYHIVQGSGVVRVGDENHEAGEGDTILIPAGAPHNIRNHGSNDFVFLCACSSAYSHEDTELL